MNHLDGSDRTRVGRFRSRYPAEWVLRALEAAGERDDVPSYVEAILKRWDRRGGPRPSASPEQRERAQRLAGNQVHHKQLDAHTAEVRARRTAVADYEQRVWQAWEDLDAAGRKPWLAGARTQSPGLPARFLEVQARKLYAESLGILPAEERPDQPSSAGGR